jgi:hypothetical protein
MRAASAARQTSGILCNMPLKRAVLLSENHKYVTLFTIGGPPNHAIMDINGDRRNRLRLVQEA